MSNVLQVGIAFIIREKFGWTLASLRRIYSFTEVPFTLYLVNSVYPPRILADLDNFLKDKNNVVRISRPRFLYPNEALNEVIPVVQERYLCIIQNDVLVDPGYMRYMLETFAAQKCDIVSPVTYEYEDGRRHLHRDEDGSGMTIVEESDGVRVRVPCETEYSNGRAKISHFEIHSLMMTTEFARKVHPFPLLNTREHIDLSIHAWKLGASAYLDERAFVGYVYPPIRDYDCDFFRFRWDMTLAKASHRYVREKWKVTNLPGVMDFVRKQNGYLDPNRIIREYDAVSENDCFLKCL